MSELAAARWLHICNQLMHLQAVICLDKLHAVGRGAQ